MGYRGKTQQIEDQVEEKGPTPSGLSRGDFSGELSGRMNGVGENYSDTLAHERAQMQAYAERAVTPLHAALKRERWLAKKMAALRAKGMA